MPTIDHISSFLESFAPLRLAADWDNVGLLVGDRQATAHNIMTCLTITRDSVAEAIDRQADLIVTHHPLPFRPLKKITADSTSGKLLLELIRHKIAVYSPHTAFDSAADGINQQLAAALELENILPLVASHDDPDQLGAGRFGLLPTARSLGELGVALKTFLRVDSLRFVGDSLDTVTKIAVACGSGGSFLPAARRQGCDLFVTGEATFHTCLEAQALDMGMLLVSHFASERFACENLATTLQSKFATAAVWVSAVECDPLQVL